MEPAHTTKMDDRRPEKDEAGRDDGTNANFVKECELSLLTGGGKGLAPVGAKKVG